MTKTTASNIPTENVGKGDIVVFVLKEGVPFEEGRCFSGEVKTSPNKQGRVQVYCDQMGRPFTVHHKCLQIVEQHYNNTEEGREMRRRMEREAIAAVKFADKANRWLAQHKKAPQKKASKAKQKRVNNVCGMSFEY
jgi:hypothetical protein